MIQSEKPIADPRNLRGWHIAGAAFCLLMLVLHVAAGLNSNGVADFWRDVYWATLIAGGEAVPLSGPPINNLLEVGPWWFYLLALPLWLTHRIAYASAFIQLLAAVKYPLAWRLGTRAVDARFGVAFAVATAVAGWSTAGLWFPSHPAVIETTLLLLAFAVWRCWDNFSFGNAILFGLAAAACVHAHPTTVLYIVAGGLALLYRYRSWRVVSLLTCAALILLLSLLPPWFDTSPRTPNIYISVTSYLTHDIGMDFFKRLPGLFNGLVLGGAWIGFLTMTKWSQSAATLAWWAYCACLIFVCAGVPLLTLKFRSMRFWFAGALCFLVCQVAFLALIRPITSVWMVPSCLPPLALCIAIGWHGWFCAESRPRVAAGIAVFALYTALVVAPFGMFLRHLHTVRLMNANPLINISDIGDSFTMATVPFISMRGVDKVARTLCEPQTLHLRLGALIETTSGSAVRNACGYWPDLRFSGTQDHGKHVAGVAASAATAIGIAPDRVIADIAIYSRVRPIAPVEGTRLEALRRMEVARRPPDEAKPAPIVFDFETGIADVVAVTNRYPLFASVSIQHAVANGAPAELLYSDGRTLIYRCDTCANSASSRWHIELTGVTANLDVVALLARDDAQPNASK